MKSYKIHHTRNVSREAYVPQSLRRSLWFQHDGAPPHYTNDVRQPPKRYIWKALDNGYVVGTRFSGLLDRRTYHARTSSRVKWRHWCTRPSLI
ncbi:hypothetical protein AVEN_47342-1 [Araneus ventricosus]|uniref:Uncharacterized protein n=1 Tax=Araneus ventricosus TaxID=182803 RepID=A0A4Y2FD47_ARAVE|nr:hypothetical protein AVEN_47342-1 [Araneus ventricosus]